LNLLFRDFEAYAIILLNKKKSYSFWKIAKATKLKRLKSDIEKYSLQHRLRSPKEEHDVEEML
jgi:hypothetical protein